LRHLPGGRVADGFLFPKVGELAQPADDGLVAEPAFNFEFQDFG